MSDHTNPTIPIAVELNEALSALANAKGIQAFERRLASAVRSLLERLGLSGEPSVKVQSVISSRAVRIRVHNVLQSYEPNVMKGVWRAVAPADLRDVPENQGMILDSGFPDKWLTAHVAGLSESKSDLGIIFEYLTRLVIEIIAERPGCLVGPAQAAAYLRTGPTQTPQAQPPLSTEAMLSLLKSLLNLGVYVVDQPLIWQTIAIGQQIGRSVEDIAESIFTQLRLPRIEIHVHPTYLNKCLNINPPLHKDNNSSSQLGVVRKFFHNVINTLAQSQAIDKLLPVYAAEVNETIQGLFRVMEQQLLNELNLPLPELVWVASSEMQDGLIAIKINDHLAPPVVGLQPGELLVNASVEQLMVLNVPGRPMTNPIGNVACALVDEVHKDAVEQGGFTTLETASFVSLVLYGEVKRRLPQLMGIEDAEYQIAQLKQAFPKLIQAATARFSMGNLTRVMRGLAAEGIHIRDARAILERMLQFDTITVESADHISFDARLGLSKARAAAKINSWQNHREFVRNGLKYFISQQYSQSQNLLTIYSVDPQVQRRAEAAQLNDHVTDAITWLNESEQEALRDSIWARVTAVGQNKMPILTTSGARAAIRELISAEMPALPIIAFSELRPDVNLKHLGTIELDK